MTHAQSERSTDNKNLARFFLEQKHVAWVSLVVAILWGIYGLLKMPQRKDPDIPVRQAMIIVPWQGTSAEQVEQLVTRKVEQAIALNQWVTEIKSASRTGSAMVQFELAEKGKYDRDKELDDVKIRLDAIHDLPQGTGPILYIKDFGDTSALMLTVASPPADPVQVAWISKLVETQVRQVRSGLDTNTGRRSIVVVFPKSIDSDDVERKLSWVTRDMATQHLCSDMRVFSGAGFTGVDLATNLSTPYLQSALMKFANQNLQTDELHPDAWKPAIIDDPANTTAALQAVAGDKYTYRDLDDFTDTLQRSLKTLSIVAKAERSGVLDENVFLNFSQERLAQYKLRPADLSSILAARNLPESGQALNARGRTVSVNTTGEFNSIDDLRNVVIGASPTGTPLYLRDLVDIDRGYENPPSFLNRYTRRDENGKWITTRAITLSIQMKKGEQIGTFGKQVDANLASVRKTLPADLVLARTSDQPLQVHDSIELFSHSLIEALVLVVVVALIGFWSWRTAILIAASMPITLALTFGVINTLGIDLQQVSIASLIIALGLLVDVPVVSGDAIVRELGAGQPRSVASWLGPTKLFKTMAFATLTNIVSYLPFLLLPGDTGKFLYSLPIVISCSLLAALLVSMTFVPLISSFLLEAKSETPIGERRQRGFTGWYFRTAKKAIEHRKVCLAASLGLIVAGGVVFSTLKPQFFPKDLQYFSYIDVWLPEDTPASATSAVAQQVESITRGVAEEYGRSHPEHGHPKDVLQSMTTFVGGGGPRFWSSATPEDRQTNYAQVILRTKDNHDTTPLLALLQPEFDRQIPGAIIDTRTLETGKPVGIPVQVRISGEDLPRLRAEAEQLKQIFRDIPIAARVRDDWGEPSAREVVHVDADRAIEVEQAYHPRPRRDRVEPFGGALNRRDVEKSLRALFLSSVGDVPEMGSEYLRQKLADREGLHLFRAEILTNSGALVRHLPADLVDFVVGAFLEKPEEHIDRFSGYPDHLMEEHGLADDHQFYPASPLQPPFLGLLNWNEAEGLRLIRSICNHAISIWRWQREQGGRSGRVHPVPLTLNFPWGQQTFWGDGQVYLWYRGTWGNHAVKSALMALDQWALTQCERGVPFEAVFRKVIEGNESVAALGVGVSLCLAYAGKSLECAFPLVTCPYLWEWDISRLVQETSFHSNEIGDWHRYRVLLNAVRKLNQYPHRRSEIRNLVVYFVCSGDEDLRNKYASAIRSFPENLPISYEEEKAHDGHLQALREKMALFSEQGDPANFKTEPTADGEHIKIWNDPPSLKQDKYRSQQQQFTQRSEFMSVAVWAQNTLENGTVGEQLSIDDAVAKATQWNQPGLFEEDDSDAFEHKQQTGAIVGAAFVAARYAESTEGAALLEWCQDVFDRAVSAIRKPSTWSARGSILSMDSTVFAAHGYASLLARGHNVGHCQRAILKLATDPLEGVQAAVFNAAKYFVPAHPAFYWVLLDLALAQCVVRRDQIGDYHSIVLDEREAKFKRELVERAEGLLESGTISELPTIPLPWVKSGASPKSKRRNTAEYSRNETVFLYNVATKVLFHSPVEPALADPERRANFLKMVGELLDYTIQEIVPPFATSRRDHHSHTPYEWVFGFSAWCGRLCAALTAAEARQVVLSRILNQDTDTALLMMQSVTRSFMIEAFLKEKEITHDNMALWSEITDWIFASPEWDHDGDHEHLDREFVSCALSVLFCAAPDFSALVCVVDRGWAHVSKFTQLLERAIKEFGTDRTLYLAVTTFLKKGGFDLMPKPALPWLGQIVQQKKADQVFWKTNGDETVELLRQLITEKGGSLSTEDRKAIILISDILTDNGVRGAGFLHQELLRAEKVGI